MMFSGTYRSEFYRAMRNLLHDQVTHSGIAGSGATLERTRAPASATTASNARTSTTAATGRWPALGGGLPLTAMADLLLTHGYFLAEDEKERQIMKPYPPLGSAVPLGVSQSARASLSRSSTARSRNRGRSTARFAAAPRRIVGIYTNLMTRRSVLEIVRAAKRTLDRGARRPGERQLHRRVPGMPART